MAYSKLVLLYLYFPQAALEGMALAKVSLVHKKWVTLQKHIWKKHYFTHLHCILHRILVQAYLHRFSGAVKLCSLGVV